MSSKILNRPVIIMLLTGVAGATAALGWAATEAATMTETRNEAGYLCKLDGKINSIGALVKDDGQLYRCTTILEERGIRRAAWVQVQMTTSIVMD